MSPPKKRRTSDNVERMIARWHTLAEAYEILARFQTVANGREPRAPARPRERGGRRARER